MGFADCKVRGGGGQGILITWDSFHLLVSGIA